MLIILFFSKSPFSFVISDSFNIISKLKVRVDFETFEISPPDNRGQCVTDFFLVTGGSPVPTICGLNSGQHSKYFIIWELGFFGCFGGFLVDFGVVFCGFLMVFFGVCVFFGFFLVGGSLGSLTLSFIGIFCSPLGYFGFFGILWGSLEFFGVLWVLI